MIIDEIGKMELYSRSFTQAVKNVFDQSVVVLATVPASKGRSLQLVEDIKKRPDCLLYEVRKSLVVGKDAPFSNFECYENKSRKQKLYYVLYYVDHCYSIYILSKIIFLGN